MAKQTLLANILEAARRYDPAKDDLDTCAKKYLYDLRQRGPAKQFQCQIGKFRTMTTKRGTILLFSVYWVYDHPMFGLIGEETPDWRLRRNVKGRLIVSPPCSMIKGRIRFHAIPTQAFREWVLRTLETSIPQVVEKIQPPRNAGYELIEDSGPRRVVWEDEGEPVVSNEGIDHLWERE